jgi:N-acetyl-1-D-myo-inositol-2-amino-2-deoxy-alpha-D-glucopyranoside deacetylase
MGVEYFTLAAGERGPGDGPNGWETDLFAGIAAGEPAPAEAGRK